MADRYDAVVVGAGHNGLTCACYLARAGLRVLVLEQYRSVGGMTVTEELTLGGFKSDVHATGYQLANLSPTPLELELDRYGLELIKPDLPYSQVFPDGGIISVHRDIEKTVRSIERYSKRDGRTWREVYAGYLAAKPGFVASMYSTPSTFATEAAVAEASPDGFRRHRFSLQSVRSWCNELFESDEVKTLFGGFGLFLGASPDDAGSAHLAWLFASVLQDVGNNLVKGGMQNLSFALSRYLQSRGGTIRTGVRVDRILVSSGRATGVRLQDGEVVPVGQLVVSAVDPAMLVLQFLGEDAVGSEIVREMEHYEWGDSVFVIYVALDGPIDYAAGPDARKSAHVHLCGPSLDYLAQDCLECRGGRLPAKPFIVSWNDSAIDPSRAPSGKALMKFVALSVPYTIKGDATGTIAAREWDQVRDQYADYLIDLIAENYIPDIKKKLLKRVAHSPLDIEQKIVSAVHGTLAHGAALLYQRGSMRPVPGLGGYRSPVPNVYLCSAGSHPGAGVSMAPGRNAAQVILSDRGIDFTAILRGQ